MSGKVLLTTENSEQKGVKYFSVFSLCPLWLNLKLKQVAGQFSQIAAFAFD